MKINMCVVVVIQKIKNLKMLTIKKNSDNEKYTVFSKNVVFNDLANIF